MVDIPPLVRSDGAVGGELVKGKWGGRGGALGVRGGGTGGWGELFWTWGVVQLHVVGIMIIRSRRLRHDGNDEEVRGR